MGKILALISGKGGVGKTMFTANLGAALAKSGYSVCLVDTDIAMANLSLLLGMQSSPITLHDVLLGEAALEDALYEGPLGITFLPSGLSLESYRRVDSEKTADAIEPLAKKFDFVLLDSPPGIGKDVMATLAASHESLLITLPTSPSIADLLKVKIVAQRLGNKPLGVVINQVRGERGEISESEVMKMLELPVYGTIPYDHNVRKSFLQERVAPVMIRAPRSPAAQAIKKIAEKLTGVAVKEGGEKEKLEKFMAKREKKGFFARLFGFFR